MDPFRLDPDQAFLTLLEGLIPDFVLAFAFFTSLCYAVLAKRFGRQRPAIVLSATLGIALAVGLVWWEHQHGYSIRDLGPIAVGLAIILIALVMYQALRQVGGSWAGAGLAIGAALIISFALGVQWPVSSELIQSITAAIIIFGLLAFMLHQHRHGPRFQAVPIPRHMPDVRRLVPDTRRSRDVSDRLTRGFHHARQTVDHLHEHPEEAADVMLQIRRMLPAEGWLTERMAGLRAQAHHVREGHVARINQISQAISKLDPQARKKAAEELKARFAELKLDDRLDRLDRAAAATEQRIRQLMQDAQRQAQNHEHQKLHDTLKAAEKLQKHNSHLFRLIDRTEKKLITLANLAARSAGEVSGE